MMVYGMLRNHPVVFLSRPRNGKLGISWPGPTMASSHAHSAEQPLLTAIANDDVEEMLAIQEDCPASVMKGIGSSLHAATMYGSIACARRLIVNRADVNFCNKDGYSPMHLAASEGDVDIIRLLLSARADVDRTTPDARARLMSGALALDASGGRNALHLAAEKGRLSAVEILFAECPCLADARDFDGALPRDVALREGALAAKLAPNRKAIAELLSPGEGIPELTSLRQLAETDARKRRQRLDDQEARAKAAKAQMATLFPADFGYQAQQPELYKMQVRDVISRLHPDLFAALSLNVEKRNGALRSLCEEIVPGVFSFQMVPEGPVGPTAGLHTRLLQEIDSVEEWANQQTDWALRRPNSMNRSVVSKEPRSQYEGTPPRLTNLKTQKRARIRRGAGRHWPGCLCGRIGHSPRCATSISSLSRPEL